MARGDPARNGRTRSSNTMTASAEPTPVWVIGILDALAAAKGQFDPENAKVVVGVMDHYADILEGMASFASAIGERSVEAVDLPPSAQEMFLKLGEIQRKSVGPARDGLAAARRTVEDRIARYQAQRPQDKAWDVGENV